MTPTADVNGLSQMRRPVRGSWEEFMRRRKLQVVVSLLAIVAASPVAAQITSKPVPTRIEKRGLAVEVVELARLPDSRGIRPADQDVKPAGWARVNYVRDLPDGRRFANDSRGFLYRIDANNAPHVYANLADTFPLGVYNRLSSGFIAFVFHPEFARNGLFYTVHAERGPGNPKTPDFIPPGYGLKDVTHHNIVTEWHATDPAANVFAGTRRELLRTAHVVANLTHPLSAVEFNPTAKPGSEDYGLLYISGSDHGFSNGGGPNSSNPAQTQRLDSIITAMLRVDPRSPSVTGGVKGLGDYTIPMANKFAADGDPNTLGEIYAYGFRNAHRLSWDTDGTLFVSDIGMYQVEEINIVHNGGNYGWMKLEGYWQNGRWRGGAPGELGALGELYPLPAEILDGRQKDGFRYPVAMYDRHEAERAAITAGFAYHGRIAALRGKFVFGDIFSGRVLAADLAALKKADDGIPLTMAPIEEVQLYERDAGGNRVNVSLQELINRKMGAKIARADLFISQTRDGELLVTSRQDGTIRMLVPDRAE
jgi:Glucose / Sorbosone dehydrogenase